MLKPTYGVMLFKDDDNDFHIFLLPNIRIIANKNQWSICLDLWFFFMYVTFMRGDN